MYDVSTFLRSLYISIFLQRFACYRCNDRSVRCRICGDSDDNNSTRLQEIQQDEEEKAESCCRKIPEGVQIHEAYKILLPGSQEDDRRLQDDTWARRLRQRVQRKLHNGVPVAVKVLDNPTVSGDEFTNEIAAIGTIHNVNIVRLLGFCVDGSKRALIYEFMPNESLDKYIMEEGERSTKFSWTKLHDISMGIARGIEYLHQGCEQRILHLDIKPQNILLDQEFNPKISDFGLAKLCSKERSAVSMTAARGTMGYMAPEVFLGSNKTVSHRSDVYSFGMVLMEMVGGRKNTADEGENAAQIYFPEWIYNQLKQGEELGLVTDSVEDAEIAKKLTMVALWCVQWRPADRPSMKVAVQMLEGSLERLPLPPNPFAPQVEKKNMGDTDANDN
ncbi:unnamed protein product [Musa banksii]